MPNKGDTKMNDMLVNLYHQKEETELFQKLEKNGVRIKRALSPDKTAILKFVEENFRVQWADECAAAFANSPISCFVAVRDKKPVGFACYDATAKDFFGPTGVLESERGLGIGKALMNKCFLAMREEGYAYAIIGWAADTAVTFYEKNANAIMIEDETHGIYTRMIEVD